MKRLVAALVLVPMLAACGDDAYSAPEREVTMREVLENEPTFIAMLEHRQYEQAWETVAGVLGIDPTDPASYLEIRGSSAVPSRHVSEMVVACAWGAVLREGGASEDRLPWHEDLDGQKGFDELRERILDNTGDGDCSTLDALGVSEISRDLPGSTEELATWTFVAEVQTLEASIARELAPEIAEAVAG